MFVLHGWWSDSPAGLTLWAEDSDAPPEPPTRRGRRPARQPHPFALAADALRIAVAHDGRPGSAHLCLPNAGKGPSASPEVRRVRDEPPTTGSEGSWEVPTLTLGPGTTWEFLLRRTDQLDDLAVSGADLRVFESVAAFAGDLVGRGQVLPSVRPEGPGQARSAWVPVVTGADAAWLRAVATGMPASATAGNEGDAATMLAAATDALVDAAVRVRLVPTRRRLEAPSFRNALAALDPVFSISPDDLRALDECLAQWQHDITHGGSVRASFRLVEPSAPDEPNEPNDGWRVEIALQSTEEPSLVVDAEQVWQARGGLRALARHVADPQEMLLAELGRAVRLYPALDDALRTARPSSVELDATAAHHFLAETAPILVAAGFGVSLPGWWSNPRMRLGAKLSVATPAQPGAAKQEAKIGQDGLVDFRWDLAVGEHTLSDEEVADLAAAQQPLVRVRGQWMYVDAERLASARAFLAQSRASTRMSVGEVLGALDSPDDGPGGLPVVDVEASGWLGDLLSSGTDQRIAPMDAPDGFGGTLRPYQQRGLAWLAFLESVGLGGILADDMGLGKTVQLLALLLGDRDTDHAPTLLVCPMSLVGNWEREAARFAPALRVHVHHGKERPRGDEFREVVAASDLVITTYGLVIRDVDELRELSWRRVLLDEAQAVKNAATRGAVAVRSLPAAHRFAVTGTPVENRLGDLWSLMEFANPGLLGTSKIFKERFANPIERHGDDAAAARLRSVSQPFLLRRLKTDTSIITDLPEKIEMEVVCSLTREQASLYQAVVTDMMTRIEETEGIERKGLVLATMTKLKQVCNHPAQFLRDGSRLSGRSGKLARLEETLDEVLASGEKALLFTQYTEFGEMLRTHLGGRFHQEVAFLRGSQSKLARDQMVTRFQEPGGPSLFVLSLKAGGTGLTLTAANHVFHVDRWWNPAVEDQATDRAFRIGQSKSVQVRKLVCAGTLEEKIAAMINDKRGLAASVVGTGEGWLTELSTGSLRELFRLESGSVVE